MSKTTDSPKPFISVLLLISTMFGLVFLQMEERRMGYEILKLSREQKASSEILRSKNVSLAKLTRPQQVEKIAQTKMSLRKIQASQVIHLTGPFPIARGVN